MTNEKPFPMVYLQVVVASYSLAVIILHLVIFKANYHRAVAHICEHCHVPLQNACSAGGATL